MFKITAIVSLMLIATWSQAASRRNKKEATASEDFNSGSTLWAAGLQCDSCGSECASACGTRHFRSCCFNYLRKKRGPDDLMTWLQPQNPQMKLPEPKPRTPVYVIEYVPEQKMYDFQPYPYEEMADNRMQAYHDV